MGPDTFVSAHGPANKWGRIHLSPLMAQKGAAYSPLGLGWWPTDPAVPKFDRKVFLDLAFELVMPGWQTLA